MDRPDELTIRELHAAFRSGLLTPSRLVDIYRDRIATLSQAGPRLQAVNTVSSVASEDARKWDLRLLGATQLPPLAGIPVVLKDHIATAGLRTTFGSVAAAQHVSQSDAAVVTKLRSAGAIILAKTAMADFGASWFSASSLSGLTKNPYSFEHDAGGSSSGTAVCVASNLCAVGIGGDTGGSIRLPASFCNIVGLRPTPGVISTQGVAPLLSRQDTVGPMTRTVEDAVRVFRVIRDPAARRSPRRHEPESTPRIRLGRALQLDADAITLGGREVDMVMRRGLRELESGGVQLVETEIEGLATLLRDSSLYLLESRRELDTFIAAHLAPGASSLADLHDTGRFHPTLDLFAAIATSDKTPDPTALTRAWRSRSVLASGVVKALERDRLEALCFPTVRVPPPTHHDLLEGLWDTLSYPTNTILAAQAGLPAVTVPFGFSASGLPVGIELVGRPFDEEALLRVAARVEKMVPARRIPNLEASA